jgi:biotin carboxyl carrier protein
MAAMTTARPVRVTDDAGTTSTIVPVPPEDAPGPGNAWPTDPGAFEAGTTGTAIRVGTGDVERGPALVLPGPDGDGAGWESGASTSLEVVVAGWRFVLTIEDEELAGLRDRVHRDVASIGHAPRQEIRSVIPGRVVGVDVAEGDTVAAGQRLLVVEAMKMQNEIRAPRDGSVVRVDVAVGGTVEIGSLLVELS